MTEFVDLDARQERLNGITGAVAGSQSDNLVSFMPISSHHRDRIRTAVNVYLWESLCHHYPDTSFPLTDDMLEDVGDKIIQLPNITPNGLILPKVENYIGFNLVQKEAIAAFDTLGLGNAIDQLQWPIHIRLQSGTPDPVVDARARASSKIHTDIWAGDPATGGIVFLAVLGDTAASGIDFFKPKDGFPMDMVKALDDYDEGKVMTDTAIKTGEFDDKGWYLADPFVLHRTTKNKPGYRISLDFRIKFHASLASDSEEDDERKASFAPYGRWKTLGTNTLVIAEDNMAEFVPDKAAAASMAYPTRIRFSHQEHAA